MHKEVTMEVLSGSIWTTVLWIIVWIAAVVVVYIVYMSWHYKIFRNMGVPGPTPKLVFGNALDVMKKGIQDYDMENMKKYGKIFGIFTGRAPLLMVADDEILKEILIKQFDKFQDRANPFEGMNGYMEGGLNITNGYRWKEMRSIMSRTFTSGKLKKMSRLIENAAENLVKSMEKSIKDNNELNVKRAFGNYTMDVIASTAFGVEVDAYNNPNDPFVKHVEKFLDLDITSPLFMLLFFMPFAIKPLGKLTNKTVNDIESQEFFRDVVVKEINRRTTQRTDYVDFLQLMIEAHLNEDIKSLTTAEIIANSIVFFFAGYETTATALSLMAHCMACNPEIQEKLHNEISEKLGGEMPNYDNISDLEYLDMCVNENLRLYPPAARFDRVCIQDTDINGMKIEKGMSINVPVFAIHHSAEFWEDPETYDPERFSPENKPKINSLHFLPFGYGPRNCIGSRLALLEIKIAFARAMQKLKFSIGEKTKIPPELRVIGLISPKKLWLKVEHR